MDRGAQGFFVIGYKGARNKQIGDVHFFKPLNVTYDREAIQVSKDYTREISLTSEKSRLNA